MDPYYTTIVPDPPENTPEVGPGEFWRALWEFVQTILLSILLFLAINALTARIRVKSISMQPTLYEKDFVLVSKLSYKFGDLHRKDIVVFHPPLDQEVEPYIKRVIGLPGDQVRIADGVVYVNDVPLSESYLSAPPQYAGTWEVPENAVFVLGDNRNSSSDSHQWGMVTTDRLIGKAIVVYWPVPHWKLLTQNTAAAAPPSPK
jgi:signal peptidase I